MIAKSLYATKKGGLAVSFSYPPMEFSSYPARHQNNKAVEHGNTSYQPLKAAARFSTK